MPSPSARCRDALCFRSGDRVTTHERTWMAPITIDTRFRGPPNSANGGYACGLLARHVDKRGAEVTLRAPPPLARPLDVVAGERDVTDLRDGDRTVATCRS